MKTFFISDLHLDDSHPEIAQIFFRLLKQAEKEAEALYILGDFFEAWIGDDDLSSFNLSIMNALKSATDNGLPIFIMHGNRDFLLGKKFMRATGCVLLPDEYVLNLYGVPTLLMHGDLLCTQDVKYLKFRKRSRKWILQKIFLLKKLKTRQKIAADYREKSKAHVSTLSDNIMDVTPDEVLRVMAKHQVLHLIHGHTHRQAVHELSERATRTVLGAWHTDGNVLVCDDQGGQTFLMLSA